MSWKVYKSEMDIINIVALDKLFLEIAKVSGTSFLHLYRFSEPGICLGRSQSFKDVRDTTMKVARRETGGSAIICDRNVLGYSIITNEVRYEGKSLPQEVFMTPESPEEWSGIPGIYGVHAIYGNKIKSALEKLKVPNVSIGKHFSVRINGHVVAGSGQRFTSEKFTPDEEEKYALYHGIIALDPWDLDRISALLNLPHPEHKIIEKLPGLSQYTKATLDEIEDALIESIVGKGAKTRKIPDGLLALAQKEIRDLYGRDFWIKEGRRNELDTFPTLYENEGFCFVDFQYPEPQ